MAATVRAQFPASFATAAGGATVTQSVTAVAGDMLVAHVVVSAGSGDTGMTVGATANGVAATGSSAAVHSNSQPFGFEQILYWTAPSAGTYNVVATVSGGTPDAVGIVVLAITGSNNSAPVFGTPAVGNSGSLSAVSPTVPTNSLGLGFFATGESFTATGQTQLYATSGTPGGSSAANSMAACSQAGSGSALTLTATAGSDWWGGIAAVVYDAAYAPAVTGTLSASVPRATASISGNSIVTATMSAKVPILTASITGIINSTTTGTLSAKTPVLTSNLPVSVWATGTLNASVPKLTGSLGQAVPDPPYFHDLIGATSTPTFIFGAEDWGLLFNGGTAAGSGTYHDAYVDYLDTRQAQGYNAVEVTMFSCGNMAGGHNGPDGDGLYPWNTNSTNPLNTPNSTWWARRDDFISLALARGMYVLLNWTTPFLDGSPTPFCVSWSTAQWQAYGTYLGTRYPASSYPNILWMAGDDYYGGINSNLSAAWANMRAAGATQPGSFQSIQEGSSRLLWQTGAVGTTPQWANTFADFNFGYSYNFTYYIVEKMQVENQTLTPIPWMFGDGMFLNSGLTGITSDNHGRRMIWHSLSSGAKGFNLGDNNTWQWDTGSQNEIETATIYTTTIPAILSYWRSLPGWHRLLADLNSALVTAGRGTHAGPITTGNSGEYADNNSDSYVTASRTPDGKLAVIYMSHASTITIDESKMAPGYTAKWVDPVTGVTSAATPGSTYNSGSKGTNSAGDVDWALVLAEPTTTTATLNASAPRLTASLPGTSVTVATLNAQIPKVTANVPGAVITTGTMAATLPIVTASIAGAGPVVGTLDAALPKVTATIAGDSLAPVTGSVVASLPRVTASIAGVVIAPTTGTLNAKMPLLTFSVGALVGAGEGTWLWTGTSETPASISVWDGATEVPVQSITKST